MTVSTMGRTPMRIGPIPLLAITTVVALAAAFAVIAAAVNQAANVQQSVRAAQLSRAFVLRLQLDEETGVRGYVETGDPVFLQTYYEGQRRFARASRTLRAAILKVTPGSASVVDDQ